MSIYSPPSQRSQNSHLGQPVQRLHQQPAQNFYQFPQQQSPQQQLQQQQQHQRHQRNLSHSRNSSLYNVMVQQERTSSPLAPAPQINTQLTSLAPLPVAKTPVEYTPFEKELYVYLTNPANSTEYEAAYEELLREVNDFTVLLNSGEMKFTAPKLNCGATGEEFIEWRDAFMSLIGPLAKAMIRMSGEDEEAQDDQLELIEKVLSDHDKPDYASFLMKQGTYKYVCLVRDYNAQILKLISDNVSNTLYNLFCSTKSAAVAYNFIKTRFNAKIWTKAIYAMATIPTPPTRHFEQFVILKEGIESARLVQPCEVPAMEFSFILEFLRSRRDIRDHPSVTDLYQRNLILYQNKQTMLKNEIDKLLRSIEHAVREVQEEISSAFNSPTVSAIGSPISPTLPTSLETLTKKVRSRGRRRKSLQVRNSISGDQAFRNIDSVTGEQPMRSFDGGSPNETFAGNRNRPNIPADQPMRQKSTGGNHSRHRSVNSISGEQSLRSLR